MNLKTRIQHVNSLPEEIRQRAISRMQEQLIFIDWHEEFLSLELCLKSSFVFKETIEGENVWEHVCTFNTEKILNMNKSEWENYYMKMRSKGTIIIIL